LHSSQKKERREGEKGGREGRERSRVDYFNDNENIFMQIGVPPYLAYALRP
jgi:hypothetical protein